VLKPNRAFKVNLCQLSYIHTVCVARYAGIYYIWSEEIFAGKIIYTGMCNVCVYTVNKLHGVHYRCNIYESWTKNKTKI